MRNLCTFPAASVNSSKERRKRRAEREDRRGEKRGKERRDRKQESFLFLSSELENVQGTELHEARTLSSVLTGHWDLKASCELIQELSPWSLGLQESTEYSGRRLLALARPGVKATMVRHMWRIKPGLERSPMDFRVGVVDPQNNKIAVETCRGEGAQLAHGHLWLSCWHCIGSPEHHLKCFLSTEPDSVLSTAGCALQPKMFAELLSGGSGEMLSSLDP